MSCFLSLRNDYLAQELTALHSGALRSLAGELQRYVFSAVSIDFSKKVRNTFLANLFLAPVIGTLFAGIFQQRPLLVIGIDIACVPLVLYAFISTYIPVIVVTVFANFICDCLQTIDDRFNFFTWHILGVSMCADADVILNDAGHAFTLTHPDETNLAIREFLRNRANQTLQPARVEGDINIARC